MLPPIFLLSSLKFLETEYCTLKKLDTRCQLSMFVLKSDNRQNYLINS